MLERAPEHDRPRRWLLAGELIRAELLQAAPRLGPCEAVGVGAEAGECRDMVGLCGFGQVTEELEGYRLCVARHRSCALIRAPGNRPVPRVAHCNSQTA